MSPLLRERTAAVESAVATWWERLADAYPALAAVTAPTVEWLQRGSTAGRADARRWAVAFNRPLLARDDGYRAILPDTVVHELAHLAAYRLHGSRGHDAAWRRIMERMGVPPQRTHNLDTTGLPGVQRRWRYRCECGEIHLTTTRHRRILKGATYLCRRCGDALHRDEAGR